MTVDASAETACLREYLDARLGDSVDLEVEPMAGGGSCDVYALTRGGERWVLRQAPPHRSSATAHDVLREFRFLDAIKEQPVRIACPVLACDDPEVFGGPFYVMARVDGVPVRSNIPESWTDFLDAIDHHRKPASDIEGAHHATTCALLGMLSLKLGRSVKWDGEKQTIPNDTEAAGMLKRQYRGSWKYPEV